MYPVLSSFYSTDTLTVRQRCKIEDVTFCSISIGGNCVRFDIESILCEWLKVSQQIMYSVF